MKLVITRAAKCTHPGVHPRREGLSGDDYRSAIHVSKIQTFTDLKSEILNYRRLISRTLLMNRHPIMVSSLYLSSAHSKESSTIVIRAENSFIEGIHSLEGKIKLSRLLEKNQKRLQD